MSVCLYACMYVYVHVCMYVCMFVCLFVCLFLFVCFYLFVCLFACLFVCLFVCVYVCVFAWCVPVCYHTVLWRLDWGSEVTMGWNLLVLIAGKHCHISCAMPTAVKRRGRVHHLATISHPTCEQWCACCLHASLSAFWPWNLWNPWNL